MSDALLPSSSADWHRRIWRLAGPIIISNMSVPLVGAVDTAVVGHLSDPVYIGAVALGAVIFGFLFWGFAFLRMGTTGFVAQAYGAGDMIEVRTVLVRAVLLGLVFGLLIIGLQKPLGWAVFWFLDASDDLERLANDYYRIRVWSAPATLANYALLGCLIALQKTRAALALQLFLNGINVTLDLVFVLVFDWGVAGVAIASLVAEFATALFALWLVTRTVKPDQGGRWNLYPLLDRRRIRALMRVNTDIFIRTICLSLGFFYFTAQGAKLGEVTLAVNAVLMHLSYFLAYGLDGFAHAAEALAGNAYGARDRKSLRLAVRFSSLWALLVAALYCLVYAVFGHYLIAAITTIEQVRSGAQHYLPWLLAMPFIAVWSYQLDGIFVGTMFTAAMRNGAIIALGALLLAVWVLLPLWGNHGLWLALMIFMSARALTLAAVYPRIEQALHGAR